MEELEGKVFSLKVSSKWKVEEKEEKREGGRNKRKGGEKEEKK